MIDPREQEVLAKAMKTNWLIWAAMVSSIGIYILVAHMTAGEIRIGAGAAEVFGLLRTVLLILGIGELVLIPLIRRLVLKGVRPPKTAAAMGTMGGSHPAVAAYTSALVVSLAIAESVAIYGLVLFFLSSDFNTLYLFAALGAAGMIVNRPKSEELERLAADMKTGGRT